MRSTSVSTWIKGGIAIALGVLYLLNPTAGILELIPDNIPIIGNLDEAGATMIVLWGIGQISGRDILGKVKEITGSGRFR